MFLTENNLKISPQDFYLAHEVLQMKSIFVRDNSYQKFLLANSWVFKFLPNWEPAGVENKQSLFSRKLENGKLKIKNLKSKKLSTLNFPLSILENLLRNFQLRYMEKRRTTEIISNTRLFFHPQDNHPEVLKEFKSKLMELKIPLDNLSFSI